MFRLPGRDVVAKGTCHTRDAEKMHGEGQPEGHQQFYASLS